MQHVLNIGIGIHLSTSTLLLIAGALVSLVGAVVVARRRRALSHRGLPPLVFEVRDRRPDNFRPASFRQASPLYPYAPPPPPSAPSPTPQTTPGQRPMGGSGGSDGQTVRMPRFDERTVEYLPGRLEIQSGRSHGQEIRFRRAPGRGETADVTLGRGDGPPEAHIKLPAETVSRHHARMQYENGRWRIMNLSRTNPTIVNGEELIAAEGARLLEEGDTIEMGEITLRFHTR